MSPPRAGDLYPHDRTVRPWASCAPSPAEYRQATDSHEGGEHLVLAGHAPGFRGFCLRRSVTSSPPWPPVTRRRMASSAARAPEPTTRPQKWQAVARLARQDEPANDSDHELRHDGQKRSARIKMLKTFVGHRRLSQAHTGQPNGATSSATAAARLIGAARSPLLGKSSSLGCCQLFIRLPSRCPDFASRRAL